eukprot:689707-Hanusia_phi.AAC.3
MSEDTTSGNSALFTSALVSKYNRSSLHKVSDLSCKANQSEHFVPSYLHSSNPLPFLSLYAPSASLSSPSSPSPFSLNRSIFPATNFSFSSAHSAQTSISPLLPPSAPLPLLVLVLVLVLVLLLPSARTLHYPLR